MSATESAETIRGTSAPWATVKRCGQCILEVVGLGVAIWILVYPTRAFRYVYGGSLARTLLKELGIGAIYGSTSIVPFIVMFYWVSIAS
jgi:hypothetical protein